MNLREAIDTARQALRAARLDNPEQEGRWMAEQVCRDFARPEIPDDPWTPPMRERLLEFIRRRCAGKPLQYVLGNTDFHELSPLLTGPGVLIPRPETEQLVETAIRLYPGYGDVCDLCTGSGAIALAIARKLPRTTVHATDISAEALNWARRNRALHALDKVILHLGDLCAPLPPGPRFSLITANPPYVSADEWESLPDVVKSHEPAGALLAPDHGLAFYRRIAHETQPYLLPGAVLVMEIGASQGEAVTALLAAQHWQDISIIQDYHARNRIVTARLADESEGIPPCPARPS